MGRKKKVYDDDDGRVISNMNIEGAPWYVPESTATPSNKEAEPLTHGETLALIWGVLKAVLLIGAVFAIAFFLFILFCDKIWFV